MTTVATTFTHGALHHAIIRFVIDHGYAPNVDELSQLLLSGQPEAHDRVTTALKALADYHGVVLHPHNTDVWVIHPFSLAPTNFVVRCGERHWWGNCAWCSLGVAALLVNDAKQKRQSDDNDNANVEVTISTRIGADTDPIDIHIRNGRVVEEDLVIHFPIPMLRAWDNVIYTCSTMLLFRNRAEVENWSTKHRIPVGDVQPVSNVWAFAQEWYGNHLSREWVKWTNNEAIAMFQRYGLTHPVWHIPTSDVRF
eukprot:TRINITY_DN12952_c0_g1_i2.p1 TRINITY_DN12952_c0_g1~~TRINITY_DN12952_c0_g1_i2.p1  ORF type:complete len:253 (-),score=42.37 TRINITY_DN12952_c0_g1_i2:101-859(-)